MNHRLVVCALLVASSTLVATRSARQDSTPADARRTRVPVTIEAKQDVQVLVGLVSREARGKLYVWQTPQANETPFVIRRGERFQMIKEDGEGQCRIRYRGKTFRLTSCPWLDGFSDHQQDSFQIVAQRSAPWVYADATHIVHVVSPTGRITTLNAEAGQEGIDAIKVADNRQIAGWLVLYRDPDGGSPFAGKLILWRSGRIIRTFHTDQTFWSWAFERGAEQVAYHVGPRHGETASHCELHDVRTGRLVESWDGDLTDPGKPTWTRKLDHQ